MTQEIKSKQQNLYNLTNSDGTKSSKRYFSASNINEAIKIAKQLYPNEFYFGKVKRCYNGGIRG
mgnify:CR=1 FL=1